MKYGCIGEHLKHSFSKEIHGLIADYEYEIRELDRNDVGSFMQKADFLAINVTIPYKETVIPYLYSIDEGARLIGAVNTVVNRDGKLYGYNTDFFGMNALLSFAGISLSDKKVLILGTGGTSKTAYAVAKAAGAKEIIKASRKASEDAILYTDVYKYHTDSQVIINTTPVGMFPNIFEKPIELSKFKKLSGVIDAVYNPLSTPLILEAKAMGIPAEGGLYMLVAQGIRASEIFLDTKYPDSLYGEIFNKITRDKRNIVLIGMPASGKTTVGKILAKELCRNLADTDALVEASENRKISNIFAADGEAKFRELETAAIKEVSALSSAVIATGGGAVLRRENISALSENGRIYFIDRPLHLLLPTEDRPLASSAEAIRKRFAERYEIYRASADVIVPGDRTPTEIAEYIINDFLRQ